MFGWLFCQPSRGICMAATLATLRPSAGNWRTPLVIIICGCAIALLSFGPRSSFGFFIQPMSREFSWGRDVFGLALAVQNLLWGLGQPVAGAIADRFGTLRVMCVGAVLYTAGLLLMRYAAAPLSLAICAAVVIGFCTCGFQLAFITVHLPAYLVDRGMQARTGGWVIATIGLFNIIGSLSVGWLQNRFPKRYILSVIYFARAMSIAAFISLPITTFSAIMFGAATGLTWLSTVPPTSALVALMFGTRWFATLYGFAFVSHQVGGFLGVLLGGIVFEKFGSYTPVWWLSVLFGVLSALINLPIVEAPVARPVAQPA